jgi:D-alanyl-D-alanine carboxypeptidase/D-alanyl-D-alanine-endopeptidase (penicillin-binding protein 4)
MTSISRSLKSLAMLSATATMLNVFGSFKGASAVEPLSLNKKSSVEIIIPRPGKDNDLETTRDRVCHKFLASTIDSIVNSSAYRGGKWGILIQSLDGTTLYSHNPDSFMIPASNMKLLTTAAAIQKYNPLSTSIRSKSLGEWVAVTNSRSNNVYADTLLRHIGGSRSVQKALTELGVDPLSYHMADGSGLSRKNLATPRSLVKVLQAMNHSPKHNAFLSSLPIAGVSGTLKNRLRQKNLEGFVRAKTGTLKGVRSLSGYMKHPEYGTLAFSIIVNNSRISGAALVNAIDEIVIRLFQSSTDRCSEKK